MAATTNPEKELSTLRRQIHDGLNESGMAELIDRIAGGIATPAEVEKLRTQVGEMWASNHAINAEYIAIRDRHQKALNEERQHDEAVRRAADEQARRDARDYATSALGELLSPLRRLLADVSKLDERTQPRQLQGIAYTASTLETRLRNDPDPAATQKTLDGMESAHNQLIRDKKRLWNALQLVSHVIGMDMRDLIAFGEENHRAGAGSVVASAMAWWRQQYDAHPADWSETFRQAVASSLKKWEAMP